MPWKVSLTMSISRFFPEFRQLQKELFDDPLLGHFLKGLGPRMDVVEMNDKYLIRADVPGYRKEQIDIDIRGSNICVNGTFDRTERRAHCVSRTYAVFFLTLFVSALPSRSFQSEGFLGAWCLGNFRS
jgi:HSP20 family molecular chaperone IbpA